MKNLPERDETHGSTVGRAAVGKVDYDYDFLYARRLCEPG